MMIRDDDWGSTIWMGAIFLGVEFWIIFDNILHI